MSLGYQPYWWLDNRFSCFETVSACHRRTDGQTTLL